MKRVKQPVGKKEFIALMAMLMSIGAISIDAMLPALGMIGDAFGVTNANHVQFVISFIFIGMATGQLVAGPLADAIGRKGILYIGISIYLVGTVVAALSTSLEMMLAGRVLQGLGVSAPYVSAVSIIRDQFAGRAMAKVMSLVMMIFIMVPTIAPALGQGILLVADWRAIYWFYMVYVTVIMLWVTLRLEESLPEERRTPFRPKQIFHAAKLVAGNRATALYTLAMGCVFGALIGYLGASQQIYQDQFGAGEMFVVYFGMLALTFGASSLLNSTLVEKYGMRYLCLRALAVIVCAAVVFAALHFVVAVTLWMFMAFCAVTFFCFGLLFGNLNALAMEPMGGHAGMAAAIIGASSSVLSIILGSTIGQMYDGSLLPIAAGFAVLGTVALGVTYIAEKGRAAARH